MACLTFILISAGCESATTVETTDKQYSITFMTNGGAVLTDLKLEQGEVINLPQPVKEGYQFDGWYSDEALTIPFYQQKMPAQNLIAHAKWTRLYSIQFETGGVADIPTMYLLPGAQVNLPLPEKQGYKFLGWYSNADLTEIKEYSVMPGNDLVFYAKWVLLDSAGVEYMAINNNTEFEVYGYDGSSPIVSISDSFLRKQFYHPSYSGKREANRFLRFL